MEEIVKILLSAIAGSGLATYFVQKYFEQKLNKQLSRFNILYSDSINVIKHLYHLLIKAEKALDIFLGQREPVDSDENKTFKDQTVLILNNFRDYFEENEILFDDSIVKIIKQIIESFHEAKLTQIQAAIMEEDRGSEEWKKAIEKKTELHHFLIEGLMPNLKKQLKLEIQEKYQLLRY